MRSAFGVEHGDFIEKNWKARVVQSKAGQKILGTKTGQKVQQQVRQFNTGRETLGAKVPEASIPTGSGPVKPKPTSAPAETKEVTNAYKAGGHFGRNKKKYIIGGGAAGTAGVGGYAYNRNR